MKTILLPTDFSENSWNAIEYALQLLKDKSCVFYLLHVNRLSNVVLNDSPYIPTEDVIEDIYTKPSKAKLVQVLKRISTSFDNDNHRFYTLTDYNFFIDSIRRHVEEKKIDMIIMGTKGASGLKKIIMGSNTGDVIVKVKCNTLVVPENAKFEALKEIAFPTDFSLFNGFDTLKPISEILEDYNAKLSVMHVSKKKAELNAEQKKNKELLEEFFSGYEHSFHFLSNKRVEDAVQCFVESRDIDMIAMVAKNLNYFQQILFHSRVEEISYHTDIPFLVLHE